jgi:benzoyl-CoA reductase/2-hydroxyglutaryl-CoA dehydratase subunit BcrC/BadD/HgdB
MNQVLAVKTRRRNGAKRPPSHGLAALDALAETYSYDALQRVAAAGKSVIWGGWSWESPLIYACDTTPVSFEHLWYDDSRRSAAIAEDYFQVPGEFCSMIKAMIGRLHTDRNNAVKRILHFGSGCEPMSAVLELAKRDGYDVQTLETVSAFRPEEKRAAGVAMLVSELRRIARWLTGREVDEDRVAREIRRKNRVLAKVEHVLNLRARHPLTIPGAQTKRLFLGSMHGFGDAERFIEVLDTLAEELTALDGVAETTAYIPLVLAGSVGNQRLFEAIEEAGGGIAGWIYHGSHPYDESLPPLESLAHYVLDAQGRGDLGEAVGASVAYRRVLVEEEVRKTGARGVISSSIIGCPYASLMQQLERDHFKQVGIPLIALETDVHREPPTEEQITRVKAFIEMLS